MALAGLGRARADDLLAYVPARLSVVAIWLTDRCVRSGLFLWRARARLKPGAASSGISSTTRGKGFQPLRHCRVQITKAELSRDAAKAAWTVLSPPPRRRDPAVQWDGAWPGFGVVAQQAAGHAQPQFRLAHDGLRLALPGAHGRTLRSTLAP